MLIPGGNDPTLLKKFPLLSLFSWVRNYHQDLPAPTHSNYPLPFLFVTVRIPSRFPADFSSSDFLKTAWWLGQARSTVGSFASRLYVENRWSWCPNSKANNFTASFLKHWKFYSFGSLGGWLALFCPAVRRAQALVLRRASRYCLVVLGIS